MGNGANTWAANRQWRHYMDNSGNTLATNRQWWQYMAAKWQWWQYIGHVAKHGEHTGNGGFTWATVAINGQQTRSVTVRASALLSTPNLCKLAYELEATQRPSNDID